MKQLRFERNVSFILSAFFFIACTILAWSPSRTTTMTSGDSHVAADTQDVDQRLKKLEMEVRVYKRMLKEQHVNVKYCVILGPLLMLKCMSFFGLCKNIKQMIKWSIHWDLLVDVIFLHIVFLPLIAISCLAYEIWSKQKVSEDVMLTAMNTTLQLEMTPYMMVWDNIKPFVCGNGFEKPSWYTAMFG